MLDIKALKSNLDLVTILTQRGLVLTPKGSSLFAHCPFHEDTTPSFSVNPREQLWQCFGCGAAGDVFTFVMMQETISFPEAVKKLCKQDIQEKDLEDLNREREERDESQIDRPSQEILDKVVAHWQASLARSTKAQAYLKSRKLWHPEILRALRVGFVSGTLPRTLPKGGKLVRQMRKMGLINPKGNECFYTRVVIPLFDESGLLVNVYGRAVGESDTPHLYLPGPRRGVFNRPGIQEGAPVILTESILDALSLLVLGFTNVTASFGTNGFTADLRAAFLKARTSRVSCVYDADPAGERAADQLAHDLAGHGIEVFRVKLPVKDPNEFLMQTGTRETFQALLDEAVVIPVSGGLSALPPPATPARSFTFGDRTYTLDSDPVRDGHLLTVALRVTREGRTFTDTLNLNSDSARARFIGRLYGIFRGKVPRSALEEDVFAVLDAIDAQTKEADPVDDTAPAPMSSLARQEAIRFLERPDLVTLVIDDLTALGVVGEDSNKLLAYIVATSRKQGMTLSLSVISGSSAGKSWLLNRVVDLMPPEDVLRYTRMSPRALFYDEPGRFKNKILFIEEAIGAKDADLGVRSMQSEKRLANLATMTDPKTGKLKTQENVVEGPLTYLTSSVDPLDYETATRSFEITIDESPAQTGRIVANLLQERTLEGLKARLVREEIVTRHQNAQRLLEPLLVVNPYASQLTFPSNTLRLRREADKYLSLIDALAFLHQRQRRTRTLSFRGQVHRYIEVERSDIAVANRLTVECLARALSDLPGPTQELLLSIRRYVTEQAAERQVDVLDSPFTRREIREFLNWTDYQLGEHLDKLVTLEYLKVESGSFGRRYVYTLSPNHRLVVQSSLPLDEKIRALGLTPVETLCSSHLATKSRTF